MSDFIKYTFNISMHSDDFKVISFKLGMVLDMSKVSSLTLV